MDVQWTIGEVAAIFNVSTDTLRNYEKVGLLSAEKNKENGYRLYSYDDIVVLMDILFFRSMELPLKEIKRVIAELDIEDIRELLLRNQKIVEKRMQELKRLQQRVGRAACQYALCLEMAGKYQFVAAPRFQYKLISGRPEDLVAMIGKYEQEDWMNDRIQYMLCVSQEQLLSQPAFGTARLGIGVGEENLHVLNETERRELASFDNGEYLYTVVGTHYSETKNAMLNDALLYLKGQGRSVAGPMIGRYLASAHKSNLDYYEIWIAVDEA